MSQPVTLDRVLRRALVAGSLHLTRLALLALPRRWDPAFGRAVCNCVRLLIPRLDRIMAANLEQVYGDTLTARERREMAERVWEHWSRGVLQFLRLERTSPAELRRTVITQGYGHLREAVARGRGAILLTAHLGNFEMLGAHVTASGFPLAALARESNDEFTESIIAGIRGRHEVQVIYKTEWRRAIRALREGNVLAILSDQAVLVGGVMVPFLGTPAPTPTGTLLLARRSGAPVLPGFISHEPDGRMLIEIHPPLELPDSGDEEADLVAGLRLVNDVISAQIRRRPEQWMWFHRRWKQPLTVHAMRSAREHRRRRTAPRPRAAAAERQAEPVAK